MPGWRRDAPVTLDFGGVWVTAGTGRDPTSADITVAIDGVVIDSNEVALSAQPGSVGVYDLVFAAKYWNRAAGIMTPTISFAAGAFVSPTRGPLGAFSERVALEDCTPPFVSRAMVMQKRGYECAALTCTDEGVSRAAFVLDIDFAEPVFGPGGRPVADTDVEIYLSGGVATVASTYVVQRPVTEGRRRVSEAVGYTRLSVAVELSTGANGDETVKLRPRDGAIWDGSGKWYVSHLDQDVVTAVGNVLRPFFQTTSANGPAASIQVGLGVPLGIFGGVLLLVGAFCFCQSRHCSRLSKARVAPRNWSSWDSRRRVLGSKSGSASHKSPSALADAIAIAEHYEWLYAKEPQVELTGYWIITLADAAVDALRDVQPACALAPSVLMMAHAVHSKRGGRAPDDLEALQALGELLRDGPTLLPESLLMAAASLDTSAQAALGNFGEAEGTSALKRMLASGGAIPKAVELGLGDVALAPSASLWFGVEPDATLKQQLVGLLRQRKSYASALAAVRGVVPDCLAVFAGAGVTKPLVTTEADAVALVLEMVEMHARLGARQREVEARTHHAVEAPYHVWRRARGRGSRVGFTDLAHTAPEEVDQACRHIYSTLVARKLKAAGCVPFSGKLRPSTEPLPVPVPRLPTPVPNSRRERWIGGFRQRQSSREDVVPETALTATVWNADHFGHASSVRLSERAAEPGERGGGGVAHGRVSSFGNSPAHFAIRDLASSSSLQLQRPERDGRRVSTSRGHQRPVAGPVAGGLSTLTPSRKPRLRPPRSGGPQRRNILTPARGGEPANSALEETSMSEV